MKTIFIVFATAILGTLGFSQQGANAVTFNFTQGGWSAGGVLTGSFSGEDFNNDSLISETEVTAFSLDWSGNSIVPEFSHTLSNLAEWQFSLPQERLIVGFSSLATTFWSYDRRVGEGIVGIGGVAGIISDTTGEPPNFSAVSAVAVPETRNLGGVMLAIALGAGFTKRMASAKSERRS